MGSERKNDQSNTWLRWALDADAALLQEIDGDSLTFDSCDCESAVQCTCAHRHRKLRVLVTREWYSARKPSQLYPKGYSAVPGALGRQQCECNLQPAGGNGRRSAAQRRGAGVRIITATKCEFIHKVVPSVLDVFKVGSTMSKGAHL